MCPGGGAPLILPFTPSRKLKKDLPSSFQSIQAKREDLYLVTETVKIAKTETLKCKKQLSFQILLELSDLQAWLGSPTAGQGLPAQTPGSSSLLLDFSEQSCLLLGLLRTSLLAPRKYIVSHSLSPLNLWQCSVFICFIALPMAHNYTGVCLFIVFLPF